MRLFSLAVWLCCASAQEPASLKINTCSLASGGTMPDDVLSMGNCSLLVQDSVVLKSAAGHSCKVELTDGGSVVSNCTVEAPVVKADGEFRVGYSRYNVWSADACPSHGVPEVVIRTTSDARCNADGQNLAGQSNGPATPYSSFDASIGAYRYCFYAYGALHLKTTLPCNTGSYQGTYKILLEGQEEQGAFSCAIAGRIFPNRLSGPGTCDPSGYTISVYCTADGYVAVRFDGTAVTTRNMHLSDYTVSFVCHHRPNVVHGCVTNSNLFNVTTALFSPLLVETFDLTGAVDLRSAPTATQ